ncbi:MAG: ribbon-helix-helix protein, CopG family, partial [Cyanobium sp.]
MNAAPPQVACTLRLRSPILAQVDAIAEREQMPRSEVLRRAVERMVADFATSSRAPLPVVMTE